MNNEYISINKKVMGGEPTIIGTRVMVSTINALLDRGLTVDDLLERWTFLTKEQIIGVSKGRQ